MSALDGVQMVGREVTKALGGTRADFERRVDVAYDRARAAGKDVSWYDIERDLADFEDGLAEEAFIAERAANLVPAPRPHGSDHADLLDGTCDGCGAESVTALCPRCDR